MEEAEDSRYWCHMCSQVVNPVQEIETVKCPFCQSGFVEEIASATAPGNDSPPDFGLGGSDPDGALSLWAPILLGMMGNPRRPRSRRLEFEDNDDLDGYENRHRHNNGEMELDQLESVTRRRRRRNSATILQLLQGIRAGMISDPENFESDPQNRDMDHNQDGERMVLINPFNQTIVFRGSFDPNSDSQNHATIGSLGDYFVGPGLDLLLQHLADNDPNRYGTPPARKEVVDALATVKNDEIIQCSVCLEDCEIGADMKEMPCRHRFHKGCILPWLELHSSCPICRYQLPFDEPKIESDMSRNNSDDSNESSNNDNQRDGVGGDDRNDSWRRFSVPLPWPFNSLFSSSSTSQSASGNSSFTSSMSSRAPTPPSSSHPDGN